MKMKTLQQRVKAKTIHQVSNLTLHRIVERKTHLRNLALSSQASRLLHQMISQLQIKLTKVWTIVDSIMSMSTCHMTRSIVMGKMLAMMRRDINPMKFKRTKRYGDRLKWTLMNMMKNKIKGVDKVTLMKKKRLRILI